MNLYSIPAALTAAFLICAPITEAAPRKKNSSTKTSGHKKAPAKKTKTHTPPPAPKLPADPHAPQHHEEAYRTFFSQLEQIAKANGFSIVTPLLTILQTTDDEFCIDLWMQRAGDEGNPVALLYLGKKALLSLPKNNAESQEARQAVILIKKAAEKKYAPAMLEYSNCLREGIGFPANEAAADKELIAACAGGNFRIRFHWLLNNGRLEKFEDLKLPEVMSEIKRGNHYILHHMALLAPSEALMLQTLDMAAKMGSDAALYECHLLHQKSDIAKSYKQLTQAVQLHNPYAIHAMARYYIDPPISLELNVGSVRNIRDGILFLKIAALLGVPEAAADLAQIYYHGQHGIPADICKSYRHASTGAQASGSPPLVTAQGFMQLCGQGTQQNTQEGLGRLQLAAKAGYAHAKELLAYAHFRGIGTEQKSSQAIYYLEDAATSKDPFAFIYLALIFDEGAPDLPADPKKVDYYLSHAEQVIPGKSKALFDYFKRRYKKWTMHPFPEQYF
ncbi:MAG: sel1 repeat family protein [Akkermansiaceae bacterium]|nr:sel1 repeat family protein [Akkermansiaceae bacterium]